MNLLAKDYNLFASERRNNVLAFISLDNTDTDEDEDYLSVGLAIIFFLCFLLFSYIFSFVIEVVKEFRTPEQLELGNDMERRKERVREVVEEWSKEQFGEK